MQAEHPTCLDVTQPVEASLAPMTAGNCLLFSDAVYTKKVFG